MSAPISLAVHRNTAARRRSKDLRAGIRDCARQSAKICPGGMEGYAVVVWGRDPSGNMQGKSWWDGRLDVPVFIEDHVHSIMRRQASLSDATRALAPDEPGEGA